VDRTVARLSSADEKCEEDDSEDRDEPSEQVGVDSPDVEQESDCRPPKVERDE
jgi:hypothetical protein